MKGKNLALGWYLTVTMLSECRTDMWMDGSSRMDTNINHASKESN